MPNFQISSSTYSPKIIPSVTSHKVQNIIENNSVALPLGNFQYAQSNDNVDAKIKSLGVTFKNTTKQQLTTLKKGDILAGLILSKNAGLKLPEVIEIEDTNNGHYSLLHPKTIRLDSNYEDLILATVHETLHKNHLSPFNFLFKIPDADFSKDLIYKHTRSIASDLRRHAFDNIYEFVACTGEKLIMEEKNWSDLNPIIKKLYNRFKGPKLKL